MGVSPIQHIGVRAHPDEWNPFSDWPHEQLEVNAEREEEVRASSIAAGQRIGLVVDDEANVAHRSLRESHFVVLNLSCITRPVFHFREI